MSSRGICEKKKARTKVPWLRKLGYSIAEAHHAANRTGHASASLEERVRLALRVLLAPHRKISPVLATPL